MHQNGTIRIFRGFVGPRHLAARQIEVLRYDYRGVGESTGVFEDLTFRHWAEDVQVLATWLHGRSPHVPLVLHGLEVGGLLAGNAFHSGVGDAALLWSPPASARQALRMTIMRWVGLEYLYRPAEEVQSAAQYISLLESGDSIEVEGYQWSSRLWSDSNLLQLPSAMASSESASSFYPKPISITKLGRQAAPLVKGGFVGYDEAKDFDWLFSPNADWIAAAAMRVEGSIHETGD